jgi:hypothetical protein
MSMRARIGFVVVAVLTVIGVWASAQVFPQPVNPPIVLSGSDVGFRITGRKGTTPVGMLVVRVDGNWVAVQLGGASTSLGTP